MPTRLNLDVAAEGSTSDPSEMEWLVWQLADSAFPTGGFAHSGGVEAAWQHGELRGSGELLGFTRVSLEQCGRLVLPVIGAAHDAPERLQEVDDLCEAITTNHVANRASRLQGQAFWSTVGRVFATTAGGCDPVSGLALGISNRPTHGHLAPIFGAVLRRMGLGRAVAQRLFLFQQTRGILASAVRLGIVGPMEAQALQWRLGPEAERVASVCGELTLSDIAQTAPLPEIWQGAQDRLYSRLFQS